MSLISFKPLGIGRSPNVHAKFVVQDSPIVQKYLNMASRHLEDLQAHKFIKNLINIIKN
jgi:hypothetical protein